MSVLVTRWSRRFVAAGAFGFVGWAACSLAGLGRRPAVTLALFGFVLPTVFGKAYALVPTYFDRELATPRAPALQWPLTVGGAAGLAAGAVPGVPDVVGTAGAVAWAAGVLVFLGAIGWTVRDNPTGAETGTGDHQADRRGVDRYANAFVPVVLAYLLAGAYATLAPAVGLPTLLDGVPARATHLLAAGTAALLVFAVGFRLFPRFLDAHPPKPLVWVVLPAGAAGPALIATGLYGRPTLLRAGAALEALAVLGFAAAYLVLLARSGRRRVGLSTVAVGAVAGVLTVALGLQFAAVGPTAALVTVHYRLALGGFLGLTIVGAALQFYPPAVGDWPGTTDRGAWVSVAALAGGLALQVGGLAGPPLAVAGEALTLAGTLGYAYLLVSAFRAQPV